MLSSILAHRCVIAAWPLRWWLGLFEPHHFSLLLVLKGDASVDLSRIRLRGFIYCVGGFVHFVHLGRRLKKVRTFNGFRWWVAEWFCIGVVVHWLCLLMFFVVLYFCFFVICNLGNQVSWMGDSLSINIEVRLCASSFSLSLISGNLIRPFLYITMELQEIIALALEPVGVCFSFPFSRPLYRIEELNM